MFLNYPDLGIKISVCICLSRANGKRWVVQSLQLNFFDSYITDLILTLPKILVVIKRQTTWILKMTRILLLTILGFMMFVTQAQKADSCFYVQVDLVNRWIWRGQTYSEAPVIHPSPGYETEKWNFLVWGSYSFEPKSNLFSTPMPDVYVNAIISFK